MLKLDRFGRLRGKPAQPGLSKQTDASGRLNHLVEGRVEEIQGAVEGTLFEVTLPHQKSQSFCGLPSMLIELTRTGEGIDPSLSFRQC